MAQISGKGGWLSTRARTDLAQVTVYSLHTLQDRTQKLIRSHKQGHVVSAEDLQQIREAMLQLWHDAHKYTKGVPLSYEDYLKSIGA